MGYGLGTGEAGLETGLAGEGVPDNPLEQRLEEDEGEGEEE